MQKQTRTLLVILLVLSLLGCESGPTPPPPPTSGGGFSIETQMENPPLSGLLTFMPFVTVSGDWVADRFGAQGNPAHWQSTTDMVGFAKIWYARAPADWRLTWLAPGPCSGLSSIARISLGGVQPFVCFFQQVSFGAEFSLSPNPLYSDSAPAMVTVTGQGISSQYGMPLLQYFDSSGNLVAQTDAIAVAEDGTLLQAATPSELASVPAGTYLVFIKNANASGGWDMIGVVTVDVFTPEPPPPPPDPVRCSPDPCIY